MTPADLIAALWFKHPVTVREPGKRTAFGPTPGEVYEVEAGVQAEARPATTPDGEEVIASATLRWHVDGPLPAPGWTVDLPEEFGLKAGREVITARRSATGTGLTPDHIEVVIK